jgi:hypothetical protein
VTALYLYLPLAHLGHYWYWLVLFLLPGLLVLAGAIHTAIRERRRARRENDDPDRGGEEGRGEA